MTNCSLLMIFKHNPYINESLKLTIILSREALDRRNVFILDQDFALPDTSLLSFASSFLFIPIVRLFSFSISCHKQNKLTFYRFYKQRSWLGGTKANEEESTFKAPEKKMEVVMDMEYMDFSEVKTKKPIRIENTPVLPKSMNNLV